MISKFLSAFPVLSGGRATMVFGEVKECINAGEAMEHFGSRNGKTGNITTALCE